MPSQSSVAKDRKFVPYGVLHYFSLGLSYDDTLANLLTSQEKNPELYPRIHAEEVEFWYNSFKKGNYDINQKPRSNPRTMLQNLPVLDHVIHSVGAEDQQALRKTCQSFKNFIDNENRLYELVELRMAKDSIMLKVECGIKYTTCQTVFKKTVDGCEITKDNKRKRIKSDEEFMVAALGKFRSTVEMMHTKIKKLEVKYNKDNVGEANRQRFLTGAAEVLNSLKEPIHVEEVDLIIETPADLDMFLKSFKPGVLTELRFETKRKALFKISNVTSRALHWEYLSVFKAWSGPLDLEMEEFIDIPRVTVKLAELTPAKVAAYKNKLIQCPNDIEQAFNYTEMLISDQFPRRSWKEAMMPFKKTAREFDDDADLSGIIRYQNESKYVLKFKVGMGVEFEREKKKKKRSEK